jgi:hypothetical protein
MVSSRPEPDSTYTHSSPMALRYSADSSPAATYEMVTSALPNTVRRPVTTSWRFHSSPGNSSWSRTWRGFSGWLGDVGASRVSHGRASTSADGISRWYRSVESDEKPCSPMSSS